MTMLLLNGAVTPSIEAIGYRTQNALACGLLLFVLIANITLGP